MTQLPLIMLSTDKGSMNGLRFGMARLFDSLFRDDRTRIVPVYYPLQVFIIDWLLMFVNQTQVGADLRYLLL